MLYFRHRESDSDGRHVSAAGAGLCTSKRKLYQAMRGVSLDTKNMSTRVDVQSLGLKSNATNDTS
jgi:hypothetical protein